MGGGAWPFLVGGVIRLVNSDNERDLGLLNSRDCLLLEGCKALQDGSRNREVEGNLHLSEVLLRGTAHE